MRTSRKERLEAFAIMFGMFGMPVVIGLIAQII